MDMFEPQQYPDDIPYPGGPPRPPYDSAGYTLAFQMGVKFDRILEGFEGPFEKIQNLIKPQPGRISGDGAAGYLLSHQVNDAFKAINHLLKSKEEVYWLKESIKVRDKQFPAGTIYIPAKTSTSSIVQNLAKGIGLNFVAIEKKPSCQALVLKPVRIGLWDRYGGSMASGWLRWLFEKFKFDFEVVYPKTLDAGNLNQKYDVLIFVEGAFPEKDPSERSRNRRDYTPDPKTIPKEYQHMLGSVTLENTIPQLKIFLEQAGTILCIGSSTDLVYYLKLPVTDALVEISSEGKVKSLPEEKFFIPGSILKVNVNNIHPLAYGMSEEQDVFFRQSPVFRLLPEAALKDFKPVAWFSHESPLRSGWALGQRYLQGELAVLDANVGKGKLFLFGPEITFRAQPHGTYKFLFNGIFYGGAKEITLQDASSKQP
jgi:hypothetical protein